MPTKPPESGGDRRPKPIPITGVGGGSLTEPENLPCPRCESTNTKFCYYNNYNLSQPRYFCKSCRRYWTRGGSLRNIPFGGHHRKNNSSSKRPRRSSPTKTTATATAAPLPPVPSSSISSETVVPGPVEPGSGSPVNLNDEAVGELSFSSLLGGQGNASGLMGLNNGGGFGFGGLGLGLGFGFGPEDVGFGLGFGKCELPMVGDGGEGGGGGGGGDGGGYDSWQLSLGGVDGCMGLSDGGDCFSWPDLAISMQSAKGLD
ncbi:hypothetical protein Droror1_Dr00006679 [Drosera rotundifolia]